MDVNHEDIITTRKHIKDKIVNDNTFKGYARERSQIFDLIKRTVDAGESNSALLIGPKGVGKTTLMNDVLKELKMNDDFYSNAILVELNGLVHTDDRLALKCITTQMNLDNTVDGKVFGSFAENLSFLLACLRTGQKETTKSIVFILEEFDLFCSHHNQTLLYNLFDVSQSAQTPICVLGITCRLDVIELFEKRVKSRFSHRQIFLFLENDTSNIDEKLKKLKNLLLLMDIKGCSSDFVHEWNKSIKNLIGNKKFNSYMQRLLDIDPSEKILKNIILLVISKLSTEKRTIDASDFEQQLREFEKDDLISAVQDLSVLELCLIIAMKHHIDIYDNQSFNFQMIVTRYNKFVKANSNIQAFPRAVVLKAFEHIENIELICPINAGGGSGLQKEFQKFRLLVTPEQITQAIQKMYGLPTEIVQWAISSIA